MFPPNQAELVIVDYDELTKSTSTPSDLFSKLETAFGAKGTGIIGIRNVPGFVEAKKDLLSLAHPLAHLPSEKLQELEDPDSLYNSGWSHGKGRQIKTSKDVSFVF